jgi:hypothetical protein
LTDEIKRHLAVILGREPGDLAGAIGALDQLRGETSGHLSHYLAKRSYEKAWILLSGENPERGVCS